MVKSGIFSFYNKSLGTFYHVIYTVRVCISYYMLLLRQQDGGSGKYIGLGLRIERGTERSTIVDIFDIIQTVRNTGIHLRVDEEQWKTARGSKR